MDFTGYLRRIMNKDAAETFNQATDSLEALQIQMSALVTGAGIPQEKPMTFDLNQAAATYNLCIGAVQPVEILRFVIRMSGGAVGGAVTSISIQTDDATPQVIFPSAVLPVAKLTNEAQFAWTEGKIYLKVGKHIQLTINGGAAGIACVIDIVADYAAIVNGGTLI